MEQRKTEEQNSAYFDEVAEGYDERYGLSVEKCRPRARVMIDQSGRGHSSDRLLELGCGTGNLAIAFLKEGLASSVTGMDISKGMIEVARKKSAGLKDCEFVVGSALQLPFPDEQFDVVAADSFLHHILEPVPCLREIRRVLKPGGYVVFDEPSRDGYAFIEFLLTMLTEASGQGRKEGPIRDYINLLAYWREHEGDAKALEMLALPDKHVFSKESTSRLAAEAGFSSWDFKPSLGYFPTLWTENLASFMAQLGVKEGVGPLAERAGRLLDATVGPAAHSVFHLHALIYLYTDAVGSPVADSQGGLWDRICHRLYAR